MNSASTAADAAALPFRAARPSGETPAPAGLASAGLASAGLASAGSAGSLGTGEATA
ncbi:hypothetical protein GCM10010389_46980 [Streptomyces echinoruber]|uniref:Uncharacterized protein n=1 Tax=Streptomyces echinoruber TaxID=68898 RepID=A0A918VIT4_9ACTN|nr:hypothetical protein GCM10010389_46980 [Streptomyces echinoruber]